MLANRDVVSTPEDIRQAVLEARNLLGKGGWLDDQSKLLPADPLLHTNLNMVAEKILVHSMSNNVKLMHPIAEAIVGGERILAEYEKTGKLFVAKFLYLLSSISDVARYKDRIEGVDERVNKLKTPKWRSTLYELLSAASLASQYDVQLITEGDDPAPDMVASELGLFFECKARSEPEEKITRFVESYRKQVLGEIVKLSRQASHGLKIQIDVHDEKILNKLAKLIGDMLSKHQHNLSIPEVDVAIEYYDPRPFALPYPMPMLSTELWMWMIGFDDFDSWHYVLPGGEFELDNYSNMMVRNFKRSLLVCVRSTELSSVSAKLHNAIKDACRRQLREHRPGVIRFLINTRFFSLQSTPESIFEELQSLAIRLVEQYESRLAAVYFDVVIPPKFGDVQIGYRQIYASRKSYAQVLDHLPSIILL
ncbi:hypothetical protein [Pseudomonas sp. ES3]|uniref:hypothetical protein n=1 Tax=Pseudomonas sp. ES3 TaxID=3424776 RepID=UPI003D348C93